MPILLLVGTILLIYFSLLIKFSTKLKNSAFLEQLTITFFILLIAGAEDQFVVLSRLNPNYLLSQGQPPGTAFIATLTILFATLTVLSLKLKFSFANFSIGLTYLISYNPFLIILILLTPISAFWSITPFFTIARGLIFVGVITAAIYVGSCYQWREILNFLRWSFAFAMIQSTFLALFLPSIGVTGKGWQGTFSHAGNLGLYAAFTSLLWLIWLIFQRKKGLLNAFILGLSVFVMYKTNSATGLILFAQGTSLVLSANLIKKMKPRIGFLVIVNFLPIGFLLVQSLPYYFGDILIILGKEPNLTGRSEFWPQLIGRAIERPILGYGFEGFWLPWKEELNPASGIINSNFYIPPHAHNGFLDLALSLGLVGLALYMFTLTNCIIQIFKCAFTNQDFPIVPLIILLFIVVANSSGNGLWEVGFHSFLFVLVCTRLTLDTVGSRYPHKL